MPHCAQNSLTKNLKNNFFIAKIVLMTFLIVEISNLNKVLYENRFLEPNPSDPLNHEAAKHLRNDRRDFARKVEEKILTLIFDDFFYKIRFKIKKFVRNFNGIFDQFLDRF